MCVMHMDYHGFLVPGVGFPISVRRHLLAMRLACIASNLQLGLELGSLHLFA